MSSPHKTSSNSPAKAMQAFETVELLENIMLNLGVGDILKAMQATRAMHDTVLGSTKIKMSIGSLPNYDCHFSAMPWEGPDAARNFFDLTYVLIYYDTFDDTYGLRGTADIDRDGEPCDPDPRKILHADFRLEPEGVYASFYNLGPENNRFFCKMGSRVRILSICPPPVAKLDFNIACRNCNEGPRSGTITASNGAYITLGDLHRGNIKVRKEHRLHCVSGKGKLQVKVVFSARVALRADDPIMAFRRRRDVAEKMYRFHGNDEDDNDLIG